MIRFVMPDLEALFVEKAPTFGIFGVKLYSQYRTYGAQSTVAEFWLIVENEQSCGAVSRLDGRFTVAATALTDAQTDELGEFLCAVGGVSVEGALSVIKRLSAFSVSPPISSWVLRGAEGLLSAPPPIGVTIERAASLRAVYDLLCESDATFRAGAPYDAWLCELSHKTRHGLAEVFTLSVDNLVVSTQSILFRDETTAILAAVATHPAARRRGYAGVLLDFVARSAQASGLALCLLAGSDALLPFYAKNGFVPIERWGILFPPEAARPLPR